MAAVPFGFGMRGLSVPRFRNRAIQEGVAMGKVAHDFARFLSHRFRVVAEL